MRAKSTVLIVDDQKFGREALEVALEAEGYELAFAANGPAALSQAAALRPDLVLLDVMMPDMDGFEVCRRLRADACLCDIPVVMVTALDDRQSRIDGIEAGADDFVTKPFDRVELRARVRTITRLNRYRRLVLERTRFEWVVDQADDGYVAVDATGRLLYANPRARLYLNIPAARTLPAADSFFGLAARRYQMEPSEAWALWSKSLPNAPAASLYLVRPESPASNALWLRVEALELAAERDTDLLLRLRDVTAQISMQRDVRAFHMLISHKLRTPLSHVLGALQMLADQPPGADPNGMEAELAHMALEGAVRLHNQIEDVLQYLHVGALGRLGGQFVLNDLPAAAARIAANLGMSESIAVTMVGGVEGVHLALSVRAMDLILRELLENARKFHPNHAPHVAIDAALADDHAAQIRIVDDGDHLTLEQLAQAWQPYQQGEKDFTGEVAGMGLGLATVASLVWEAGGSCLLYNRPDQPGVVVELRLALADGFAELGR